LHTQVHIYEEVPMDRAYFSEPTPLKQSYPEEPDGIFWINVAAIFFPLVAIFGILPSLGTWPGSWWSFMIVLLVPAAISAFLFWLAPRVAQKKYEKAWKQAFQTNNQDLALDYAAIDQVCTYLQAETSYRDVYFIGVATSLAISLRRDDPFEKTEHTSFSLEVIHAYYHLKDGSKPFILTACPRFTVH